MTAPRSTLFNTNSILVSVCTFIMLAAIGWVGRTASNTHDSVIALEVKMTAAEANVVEIKSKMLTRTDLGLELLKLQVGENKLKSIPELPK